jgi:hypothetical protein
MNRKARVTQAEIARAVAGAKKAGIAVGRIEVAPSGNIVIFSKDEAAHDDADAAFEKWQAEDARKAQRHQ